jgi:hypothetical protein
MGRLYIIFMLWATGTSLLVHNAGLPTAVLISFVWVLGGLTVGWLAIVIHKDRMRAAATQAAQQRIKAEGGDVPGGDLGALISREAGRIAAGKTFAQRFFSLKALHGSVFFVSWINIVGERRVLGTGGTRGWGSPVLMPGLVGWTCSIKTQRPCRLEVWPAAGLLPQ